MPAAYESLLVAENVLSGVAETVYVIPRDDIETFKVPVAPFTELGDELIIKTAHVLKPGKKFYEFQLAPQKNKLDYKTKGDIGSMGQTTEAEAFMAGSYAKLHETQRRLLNTPLVVIFRDSNCDADLYYHLGCDCQSAWLSPEFSTGKSNEGSKGYLIKFMYDGGPLFYQTGAAPVTV